MAEQPPAKADSHDALEHIAHRREGSGFLAESAQHIGHTGSARAVGADVVMVQILADEDAGVHAVQQIGFGSDRSTMRNAVIEPVSLPYTSFAPTSPEPRSRTTRRMGVCSRPKFSRIWLMIYR